ncbi:MAG: hypothetical protein ACKVRP_11315 [Bacteroidota bacterium]
MIRFPIKWNDRLVAMLDRFKHRLDIFLSKIQLQNDQQNTGNNPSSTSVPPQTNATNPDDETTDRTQNAGKLQQRPKRFKEKVVSRWVITIATVGAFIYTVRVFDLAVQGSGDTKDATEAVKKAADATSTMAEAARKSIVLAESSQAIAKLSLTTTRKNFQVENRPWVGIERMYIVEDKVMLPMTIKIIIKNYGKTPANSARIHVGSYLNDSDRMKYLTYKQSTSWMSDNIIPPSETINAHLIQDLPGWTERKVNMVKNKTLWLFVYGYIHYTDIFDGRDTTEFCSVYSIETNGFTVYEKFNRMK